LFGLIGNFSKEEDMMSRKMTSAQLLFLALLLTTVPAWSSMPGHFNPADSGKSLTATPDPAADYPIETEIILARGGNGGGGGGNGGGNGGQGGNGNGHGGGGQGGHGDGYGGGVSGGHGDGDCDGDGDGPAGPAGPAGDAPGPGPAGPAGK
jgi:hypothetical protein